MFGFFIFAQPRFADVPFFPVTTGGDDGAGSGPKRHRHTIDRREMETRIEIMLLTFLNTQQ